MCTLFRPSGEAMDKIVKTTLLMRNKKTFCLHVEIILKMLILLPKWDGTPIVWAFNYHPSSSSRSNSKNLRKKRSNVNGLNFERVWTHTPIYKWIFLLQPTLGSTKPTWHISICRCLVFTWSARNERRDQKVLPTLQDQVGGPQSSKY